MGKGPRTITPRDNARELKTESVPVCIYIYVYVYAYMYTRVYVGTPGMNLPISSRCAHVRWKVFNFHVTMFYMAAYAAILNLPERKRYSNRIMEHDAIMRINARVSRRDFTHANVQISWLD